MSKENKLGQDMKVLLNLDVDKKLQPTPGVGPCDELQQENEQQAEEIAHLRRALEQATDGWHTYAFACYPKCKHAYHSAHNPDLFRYLQEREGQQVKVTIEELPSGDDAGRG